MSTKTTNGTINFITSSQNAGSAMLADMVAMEDASGGAQPEILPVIGALAAVTSSAIAAGQLGLNVANAANGSNGALEVELRNFGSNYIAPFAYDTDDADMSAFPGPIPPGEADNVTVTASGGFSAGDSKVKLQLLVGADQGGTVGSAVEVTLEITWGEGSSPGLWKLDATVDGSEQSFSSTKGLVGVQYTGNTGYPSFDLFFAGIETGGGQMLVTFYDQASAVS